MASEQSVDSADVSVTRRSVLACVGALSLAGCTASAKPSAKFADEREESVFTSISVDVGSTPPFTPHDVTVGLDSPRTEWVVIFQDGEQKDYGRVATGEQSATIEWYSDSLTDGFEVAAIHGGESEYIDDGPASIAGGEVLERRPVVVL